MADGCGGCSYHHFPYKAKPPIKIDGEHKTVEFNSLEDVWGIIDLLQQEIKEADGDFDEDKSLIAQLPYFTCPNLFYTKEINRLVERYTYCKDNNVAPYAGPFGEQPYKWVKAFFTIKNAFAKKESIMLDKAKAKAKNGK